MSDKGSAEVALEDLGGGPVAQHRIDDLREIDTPTRARSAAVLKRLPPAACTGLTAYGASPFS